MLLEVRHRKRHFGVAQVAVILRVLMFLGMIVSLSMLFMITKGAKKGTQEKQHWQSEDVATTEEDPSGQSPEAEERTTPTESTSALSPLFDEIQEQTQVGRKESNTWEEESTEVKKESQDELPEIVEDEDDASGRTAEELLRRNIKERRRPNSEVVVAEPGISAERYKLAKQKTIHKHNKSKAEEERKRAEERQRLNDARVAAELDKKRKLGVQALVRSHKEESRRKSGLK